MIKNGIHKPNIANSMREGKTPMEKNVAVVDEQGHSYGATYPKRAKGLVKNGRARFVDENTICLACPPNEILEDNNMSENANNNVVLTEKEIFDQIVLLQKQLTEQSPTSLHRLGEAIYDARGEGEDAHISDEQVADIGAVFAQREETLYKMLEFYKTMYSELQREKKSSKSEVIDIAYVLSEIKATREQTAHINEALKMLEAVRSEGHGVVGAQEKAKGIATVVQCRETTNQQALRFYEKLYDDLRSKDEPLTRDDKIEKITMIQHSILDVMQKYQSEETFADMVVEVKARLDALCTDILADKL